MGHVQEQEFISTFGTQDRVAPVIDPLPINGASVRTYKPTITATYRDDLSGISTSSVVLTVDNVNVTSSAIITGNSLTYTPATPLSGVQHTVTVQVSDNAGNRSVVQSASFTIDNSGPIIANFTIGGVPAINDMVVASSLQPVFSVTYNDDTGINTSNSQFLLGPLGGMLLPVSATVTQTGMTYQSPSFMAKGRYAVQAIIVNNLGSATTVGPINFTLDPDAPDITSVMPATGNQHGGTSVVLTGNRLLNTNNAPPIVLIGGAQAQIVNINSGVPNHLTIITPAGTPGPSNIEIRADRGNSVLIGGFTYEADPKTPFAVEPDTAMLWHLDEAGNGGVTVRDSGYLNINGASGSGSLAEAGRFAGGRSNASVYTFNDYGALDFGSGSFTAESWIKTGPIASTRSLFYRYSNVYGYVYRLDLQPSGELKAMLLDTNNTTWQASVFRAYNQQTGYWNLRVDDNYWHHIAMVVDRSGQQLKLYVDGVERASSTQPANFGAVRGGNYLYVAESFSGVIDEVRFLNYARTSTQIYQTWFGPGQTSGQIVAPKISIKAASTANSKDNPTPIQPTQPSWKASPNPKIEIPTFTFREKTSSLLNR